MGHTLEVVKRLESNAYKLIQKCIIFKETLEKVHLEKAELELKNKKLEKQLYQLSTENEQLKTANALLGSKDYKRETKLKINRLIREVDSCIIQLSE
jgi:regulator of replication initiation timing